MLTPELAAEFVRAFETERAQIAREAGRRGIEAAARLAEVERRITGIVASVENGAWNRTLGLRLEELEREQEALKVEVADAATAPPVVRLHPRAADLYRDKVAVLEVSLSAKCHSRRRGSVRRPWRPYDH